MLYFIVAGISGFALAASIIALKKIFFELIESSVSLTNEVLSKEDEVIKQKKLIGALKKILLSLLKTTVAFVIIACATLLPLYLYSLLNKVNFESLDFSSLWFILSLSIGSILPFILFKKKKNEDNYSEASKLFHRLILNNYNLSKLLFSFDKKFKKGEKIIESSNFVIVSGLARAGTTSLTDQLYKAGKFSSLDYSNMPLLLAPNLWKKLYNPKNAELKERKHGDRMMFGLNTIEALEEYFFKVFLNDSFIDDSMLVKHEINKEVYDKYLAYQSLIRSDNAHLYLSKNNNLILRYPSLRALNKDFKAIFLFRNPIEHAYSLLNQHLRFSDFQHDDDFIETYMNWLGHHEFGYNQKVFSFDNKPLQIEYDKSTLDYWLSVWLNYYSYLLSLDNASFILIDYQDYLSHPKEVLVYLQNELKMEFDLSNVKPFNNNKVIDTSDCNKELLNITESVYGELKEKKVSF
ncbi:sulfotransferase domain-containing protein [Winogradskyella sp. J14-2]|uniref:sulfotransferase domain-containing protein n=1 Tax=Winogradskyella sp. J14-2 TaxID=1936080 RepID=UPI001E40CAC7|nr:sulfotransferase domain-containing protein [Winogradskyella sp. J14-2]